MTSCRTEKRGLSASLLVPFLVVALVLVGCGDGSASEGETVTGSSEQQDPDGPSATESTQRDSGSIESTASIPAGDGQSFEPPERADGIEFIFADGALGPVELGSTIESAALALGPDFEVAPVDNIRVGFPAGYSVSRGGEVLFWAIEESDVLTLFMTSNPKVGLDSGLRPRLGLTEAIDLHGEPTLTLGPELREFAAFADGTGGDGSLSVLVAIGQFGGPVGIYDEPGGEALPEAEGYVLEDANVKELWFSA